MKTVCILTAGLGTRIKKYSTYINKSLLPLKNKAAISHIIEKFPPNTSFVIAVGHLHHQVKDYLNLAYPKKKINFIKIDKYFGKNSGRYSSNSNHTGKSFPWTDLNLTL